MWGSDDMLFHDAYLRRTPWELAFATAEGAEALPEAVRDEAARRGLEPSDPHAFLTLECVTRFVRDVRGPDAGGAALVQYGRLVYHAVHFSDPGRRVLLVSTGLARELTSGSWTGPAPTLPGASGYVQLPRHLFWLGSAGQGAAEPVDGWFWTTSVTGDLHVLVIAGLREDRGGFVAVPVPEAPWTDAAEWSLARVRPDGGDFRSTLPGGELGELCSIEMAGEVLKLTARLFGYLAVEGEPSIAEAVAPDADENGPPRSALSYVKVEP